MICTVCKIAIEGVWDPTKTRRLARRSDSSRYDHPHVRKLRQKESQKESTEDFIRKAYDDVSEAEQFVFQHHLSQDSYEESRRQGCKVCRKEPYPDMKKGSVLEKYGCFTAFCLDVPSVRLKGGFQLDIYFGFGLLDNYRHHFEPCPPESRIIHSSLTNSTQDTATWSLAEIWLHNCVATHEFCSVESNYLPTRLLKLEDGTFQLVLKEQIKTGSRYAALSYCWGGEPWDPHLILNRNNFPALSGRQALSILPKTFRDAFEILRRLDIQYIWIDRFCIFQDSPEDWRAEASVMQAVYKGAFICISALGAANDNEGCFFTRDLEAVLPTAVNLSANSLDPPEIHCSEEDFDRWRNDEFRSEPLVSRAWVAQERLLAQRTLHFGQNQVFWECNQEYHSEAQPHYDWRKDATRSYDRDVSIVQPYWKALIGQFNLSEEHSDLALGDEWRKVVAYYSRCKLTKPEDKLVALSAVVKDMKKRMEQLQMSSRYLAGMWYNWLPQALLWRREHGATCTRHKEYHAPTWSWASLEGEVSLSTFCYTKDSIIATVTQAETVPLTDDDTGQISHGSITLKAKLVVIRTKKTTKEERTSIGTLWSIKAFETIQGSPIDEPILPYCAIDFDVEEESSEKVFFLPISVGSFDKHYGILLSEFGSKFRRVGAMTVVAGRGSLEVMEWLKDIPDSEVQIL